MDWDDLRITLAICRAGSLTAAARSLGVDKSTVFRQINAIEKKMGVRFFERLPHGYQMTEAGEMAMQVASRIEDHATDLERHLLGKDFRLQGDIRVTAPEGIASQILTPLIANFCSDHPQINIELDITNIPLELSRREADVAVRVTRKPPDTSLGRCIGQFNFCAYASNKYLKCHPNTALSNHDWVGISDEIDWLVPLIWKKKQLAKERIIFQSGSTTVALNAAKRGMGVILLPCFLGDSERALIRVSEPFANLANELWVLTHSDLRHTARVRALMSFLYDALRKKALVFLGAPGHGEIIYQI